MTLAIQAQDLTLGYGNTPLVNGVDLSIEAGEFLVILGPNGSGKSTFLKTLLGLIPALSGAIDIAKGFSIGYMPQIRSVHEDCHFTGRALLAITSNGGSFGLPILTRVQKQEVRDLLELVNATAYADRPFRQLSGGERQRIYLAQALLGQPRILLLDEPLSNLDPKYQEKFITLLNQISQQLDITVLLTAHDPNPLLSVISRVLFFANNNCVIGPVDEIITSKTLSSLYDTAIEVTEFKNRLFVLSENDVNVLGEGHHHHD